MSASEPIRIELLYFDGCPSYRRAWSDLLDVITAGRFDATVRPVLVDDVERADALEFVGSPAIRVNGRDLEGRHGPGAMACRVYRENGNLGWPSRELLLRRLEEAVAISGSHERGEEITNHQERS